MIKRFSDFKVYKLKQSSYSLVMKKILSLITLVVICLSTTNVASQNGTLLKDKQEIALITAVTAKGKDFVIAADFVQMLTGKEAIKAAKKAGEADYDIDKKKDTVWYVPNDFYILNNNPAIRQLHVSPSVHIFIIKTGGSALVKSSMSNLKNNFVGKLFHLILRQNEIITIEEIYTP